MGGFYGVPDSATAESSAYFNNVDTNFSVLQSFGEHFNVHGAAGGFAVDVEPGKIWHGDTLIENDVTTQLPMTVPIVNPNGIRHDVIAIDRSQLEQATPVLAFIWYYGTEVIEPAVPTRADFGEDIPIADLFWKAATVAIPGEDINDLRPFLYTAPRGVNYRAPQADELPAAQQVVMLERATDRGHAHFDMAAAVAIGNTYQVTSGDWGVLGTLDVNAKAIEAQIFITSLPGVSDNTVRIWIADTTTNNAISDSATVHLKRGANEPTFEQVYNVKIPLSSRTFAYTYDIIGVPTNILVELRTITAIYY